MLHREPLMRTKGGSEPVDGRVATLIDRPHTSIRRTSTAPSMPSMFLLVLDRKVVYVKRNSLSN